MAMKHLLQCIYFAEIELVPNQFIKQKEYFG